VILSILFIAKWMVRMLTTEEMMLQLKS